MVPAVSSYHLLPIEGAALLLAVMLGMAELGRLLARRRARRRPADGPAEAGVVTGAVFGLLGLLLAFEFAGAGSRLEARRAVSVNEVNAIGTAWLRLDLLEPADQGPLREAHRRYLESRVSTRAALPDLEAARVRAAEGEALAQEIWSLSVEASRHVPPAAASLVLAPVNQMIDLGTTGVVLALTRAPAITLAVLGVVAALASLLAGYSTRALPRARITTFLLFSIIAVTFYLILDLDQPRAGAIQIGAADDAFNHLLEQMAEAR